MGTKVLIKKLHPDAVVPVYKTAQAAGADLYAVEDTIIRPGETATVRTGLAVALGGVPRFGKAVVPEMQIRDRSGLAATTKLRVANSPGTVDTDYRGEVQVIMDNIAQPEYYLQGSGEYRSITTEHSSLVRLLDGERLALPGQLYPVGTYLIRKGDRIAQAVFTAVWQEELEITEELPETERGEGGLGSTGIQ